MPLVNSPLLEYQLSYLRAAGIHEVCFATNYMADAVEAYFGDGSSIGMDLHYAVEEEPLDTAGAIRNAYEAIPGDDCVVFNGDVIHGFDIADIIRQHKENGADVTLTLREVNRPHAYGVVPVQDGLVQGFLEPSDEDKRAVGGPTLEEIDTINAGLYVMSAAALETIPLRRCNVEREIFPKLVEEGWKVYGDVRDDYWIDIGRPTQYLEAVAAIVSGKVHAPHSFLKRGDAAVHESAEVDETARLCCDSAIAADCCVEASCDICASALLEGVHVMNGAKVIHSIIGENSVIGPNAQIKECVIAAGTVVGEHSFLGGFA